MCVDRKGNYTQGLEPQILGQKYGGWGRNEAAGVMGGEPRKRGTLEDK